MASIDFIHTLLLLGALLVVAGIFSSLIASRFGAPLLLVFLIIGMLAGEDGPGGIVFNDYHLTYLIGSLALAVILFDGGLRTKLASFRGVLTPSLLLATVGVVATAGLTGILAYFLFGFSWVESLLIGATVASTDAAAVFFLLRTGGLQLRQRVHAILEIESGTNDPMAVFLTVVLVQLLTAGQQTLTWEVFGFLVRQAVIGIALGVAGGFGASWLLNRVTLPTGLHPLFVVANAVLIYALTAVSGGSGFLAVYLAGLVLGNRPVRALASITSFHDTATWLSQIVMFLVLGLLVTPTQMIDYALPSFAVALWLIVVARPAAVWLCLLPFKFSWRETAFVSWVGLRGAVGIFLASIPTLAGVPHAEAYFNVAFFVVLVSLIIQGWTINFAAKRLGLALPRLTVPVQRVELDLPGQLEYEIVGFPVAPDSPVLVGGLVPKWARPVLVVRDNAILDSGEASRLQAGDHAYFLVSAKRANQLDHLFASLNADPWEHGPAGEFIFVGTVSLAKLRDLYGLDVALENEQTSISDLYAKQFDGKPQIGDRLPFGGAWLIARELSGSLVSKAGLQIQGFAEPPAAEKQPPVSPADSALRGILRAIAGFLKRMNRSELPLRYKATPDTGSKLEKKDKPATNE